MLIAGVMSGSSLDGLDVAVIEFVDDKWKLISTFDLEYSKAWEDRLRNYHVLSASKYVALKYDYSHLIGEVLRDKFEAIHIRPDYISFHGHTLIHNPSAGYTEQIGNGGIIAGITGISTFTDFRNQDIALGGVGTPLAPFLDVNYIGQYDYYLNLGGIANITKVTPDGISAYDICPCNQVLNHFSLLKGKPYDDRGRLAMNGKYLPILAEYFSSFEYFDLIAPKSLDNNWIREEFISKMPYGSVEDTLNTYCVWMARCIADQVNSKFNSTLFVSGGGTHNSFFIERLNMALIEKGCKMSIQSEDMIDFKEAILMAALAKNYLDDKPNVLSEVTGASRDSIGGALYKV